VSIPDDYKYICECITDIDSYKIYFNDTSNRISFIGALKTKSSETGENKWINPLDHNGIVEKSSVLSAESAELSFKRQLYSGYKGVSFNAVASDDNNKTYIIDATRVYEINYYDKGQINRRG